MANIQYPLTYKTRGQASPQGKPKVYFCCHPDDFGYLFESVAEEILAEQNCAVWYPKDRNALRDDTFLNDLSQMQLFVMPVTAKLLHTENPAIDVEFPFAVAHHIPILPLMQESDLAALFNQKCGNLQFLDKFAQDASAIPYAEKLKAFLSSVLIGDDLARKVRAAFDAYIFLSYRKKDRQYARELMRLIHKNEFCRDIAIWYDEFLTPGENFNDAIKQALDKSALFVMAVTPNLVEEQNYVMTTEYPMAREAGKTILPAEMVRTDRALLSAKYECLPSPTDARDEAALSESLMTAVRFLAIRENDSSPEHTFFIGLAYLGGIDVEVDHERALSLITQAAEAGLPEAVDKLVQMYEKGEGVARSYGTALTWRERKVAFSEQAYQSDPNAKGLHTLVWDILECGDAYIQLGQDPAARTKYEDAVHHLETSAESNATLRRDLAVAYDRLGNTHGVTNGKTYFERSLALVETLCREDPTPEARLDLAFSYRRMGVPGLAGSRTEAENYRKKAIALAEEIVKETGSLRAREQLLDVYRFHGVMLKISALTSKEILPAVRDCYERSLAIAEEIFRETGSLEARRDLADSYGLMGSIHGTLGEFDTARRYHDQKIDICEEVATLTDALQDHRRLAGAYTTSASLCEKAGGKTDALFYYTKSLTLRQQIAEEFVSRQHSKDLVDAYDNLGRFYQNDLDVANAVSCFEKAIAVRKAMCEKSDDPIDRSGLADAYLRLANYVPEGRQSNLQKALALFQALHEQHPEEEYYANRIAAITKQL